MSVFYGIGLGPIQTGIFLAGAAKGGFDRIVIAEVDDSLKEAVRAGGGKVSINIAYPDGIRPAVFDRVEVYNPNLPLERAKLVDAAAEAEEFATALPSVRFFAEPALLLREAFLRHPEKRRFLYTAENHNYAAEELQHAVARDFPDTWYLNTVIGKMSGVVREGEPGYEELLPLAPGAKRAHLVEAFDRIYISSVPGIEERRCRGLHVKEDLLPFEEAKLYGHNATHFLLAILGREKGWSFMSELGKDAELMDFVRQAFVGESGVALCRKYASFEDELFTPEGFAAYADDLLIRMTNPYLRDAIERIIRDLPRKLAWGDRVIGTMRLALSQGVTPAHFAAGAAFAAREFAGSRDQGAVRAKLAELWPTPWDNEHQRLFELIAERL